jgi:DNA uptake protein ComE-like DNA-binding protein
LSWLLVNKQTIIPATPPAAGTRTDELLDRIDPNTADWAALATLPALGPGLAKRIVEYREQFTATHPGQLAFTSPQDLQNVRGIGPAIVTTIAPYLAFPTTAREGK